MYVAKLPYPVICRWTSRLLPCPSYCKQCCNEHWGNVSLSILVSSVCMPSSGIAGLYGSSVSSFLKESPHCSPEWLYQFTFPPTVLVASLFSTPSPAFIVCRLFDSSHSDWHEMVPQCGFNLHFSDNE